MLTIIRITRSSSKIINSNNLMIKSRTTTATPITITAMISNISSQQLQHKMITKTLSTLTDNHHTTNNSSSNSSINKTIAINSNSHINSSNR